MNFRVQKVFSGSLGEQYSFSENDPVKVLVYELDNSENFLLVGLNIRQQAAGYLDTRIYVSIPLSAPGYL
jgi:hypothetical protein